MQWNGDSESFYCHVQFGQDENSTDEREDERDAGQVDVGCADNPGKLAPLDFVATSETPA